MNKIKKVFLITAVSLIAAGALLSGIGIFVYHNSVNIKVKDAKVYDRDREYVTGGGRLNKFKNMQIDTSVMDIEIKKGDKYFIEYVGYQKPKYEVKNDTLYVNAKQKNSMFQVDLNFMSNEKESKIIIHIPSKLNNIAISSDTSDITLSEFEAEKLDINGDTGDIKINHLNLRQMDIKNDTGDIKLKESNIEKVHIDIDTGDTKLEKMKVNHMKIDSDTGNVDADIIGKRDDYAVDLSGDEYTTNIEIDGEETGSIKENTSENNSITITNDTGDISVRFMH